MRIHDENKRMLNKKQKHKKLKQLEWNENKQKQIIATTKKADNLSKAYQFASWEWWQNDARIFAAAYYNSVIHRWSNATYSRNMFSEKKICCNLIVANMKYNWRTRLTWIHFMIYNNWQNHKSVHNFECGKDETVKWMLDRCERQKTKKPWDNQTRQHEDKNEKQVTWLKRQYYMFMTVVKKWLRLRFLMGPISFSAFINNPK